MCTSTLMCAVRTIREGNQITTQLRSDLVTSLTVQLDIEQPKVEAYLEETFYNYLPNCPERAIERILCYYSRKGHLPLNTPPCRMNQMS